jgi:hypothetical protein
MRYGFYLRTRGPTATRDGILALARAGERLGFNSAMIADRIVLPVEKPVHLPVHIGWQAPERRRCAGDVLDPRGGSRCNRAAAPRHLGAGAALPQSGANREDCGVAGCLVWRPAHLGRRRRLAEGRIRGAEQPGLQCVRRGDRRMDHDLQATLVAVAPQLQWPLLPILRYPLRTLRAEKAAPADLGRWALPRRAQTHRPGTATAGTR